MSMLKNCGSPPENPESIPKQHSPLSDNCLKRFVFVSIKCFFVEIAIVRAAARQLCVACVYRLADKFPKTDWTIQIVCVFCIMLASFIFFSLFLFVCCARFVRARCCCCFSLSKNMIDLMCGARALVLLLLVARPMLGFLSKIKPIKSKNRFWEHKTMCGYIQLPLIWHDNNVYELRLCVWWATSRLANSGELCQSMASLSIFGYVGEQTRPIYACLLLTLFENDFFFSIFWFGLLRPRASHAYYFFLDSIFRHYHFVRWE